MQIILPKKKEFLLFLISSLLSLIFGIFILAYYFQKNSSLNGHSIQFNKDFGWVTIPNLSLMSTGKKIKTNSLGFRSSEVDPNKKHILVVGDSVVWELV